MKRRAIFFLSFTLFFVFVSYKSFSIERDSLLTAINKSNSKVIFFDHKIKVFLKNGETYDGEYKILNDSTIIINDTVFKLSDIKAIQQVNPRNTSIIAACFFYFISTTILLIDGLGAAAPASLLAGFVFMFLLLAAPKKLSSSKYQFKVLPLDNAYIIKMALKALGLMLLGILFSNLGILSILVLFEEITFNEASQSLMLLLVPAAFIYSFGIISFFKGYTNSFYAKKIAQFNNGVALFNIIFGSIYLIANVILYLLFVIAKLFFQT